MRFDFEYDENLSPLENLIKAYSGDRKPSAKEVADFFKISRTTAWSTLKKLDGNVQKLNNGCSKIEQKCSKIEQITEKSDSLPPFENTPKESISSVIDIYSYIKPHTSKKPPSLVNSVDSNTPTLSRKEESRKEFAEPFEAFWKAYPQCTRKVNKKACLTAYRVIMEDTPESERKALQQEMIDALTYLKLTDDFRRGYIPLPLTWLHQRRWEGVREQVDRWKNYKPF